VAFEGLLRQRKIHPHRATRKEIARLLALADRDIRMARHIMAEDEEPVGEIDESEGCDGAGWQGSQARGPEA